MQSYLIFRTIQLENKNIPVQNLSQFGLFMTVSALFSLCIHSVALSPKTLRQDTAHISGVCIAEKQTMFMGATTAITHLLREEMGTMNPSESTCIFTVK